MLKRIAEFYTTPNKSLVFIGLMCFLPFITMIHNLPMTSFYNEWVAATFGLLGVLTLLKNDFWQSVKIPKFSLLFAGLATILILQWALGMLHSAQAALLFLSYFAWAFLLTILGAYLKNTIGVEKVISTLAWFFVIGGLINAVFLGLQIAVRCGIYIAYMPNANSPYGMLSQVNNFADYITLATASIMYLYAKNHLNIKLFFTMLVIFLTLLAFSGSKSTWLYLATFTTITIMFYIKTKNSQLQPTNWKKLLLISLMLLPIFAGLQALLYYALPDNLIDLPTERLIAYSNGSTSLRWQMWHDSWRIFLQSPWLGIGMGNLRWYAFLLLDSPDANASNMIFEHSHNLFIQLLTEMGIIAPILAFVVIVSWLYAKLKKFNAHDNVNVESWWLITLIAVMGIHSMLEYPLWYAYFLGIAAFLFGLGEENFIQINSIRKTNSLRLIFTVLMLLGMVNLTNLLIANVKIERWILKTFDQSFSTKEQKEFATDYYWVKNNSLLAPYAEFGLAHAIEINSKNIDSRLSLTKLAIEFIPGYILTYKYSLLLEIKGDHKNAVKFLKRSMITYPESEEATLERTPMKYRQYFLQTLSDSKFK